MGRKISSLFLAAILFVTACPVSVRAENGKPLEMQETGGISETRMSLERETAGQTEIPEETTQGTDLEETVVFGESVSGNGTGSGDTPDDGDPEETVVPGLGDALPVWDESQELMLYGLADAAVYGSRAVESGYDWGSIISRSVNWMRGQNQYVLNETFLESVSSTATDWSVFGLARLGVDGEPYGEFADKAASYVADKKGKLNDKDKATEWHRLTVALQAAALRVDGVDVTNIRGYDLIKDGTYNCMLGSPSRQGANGTAWALIAMDTKGYVVPNGAPYGREVLIKDLLNTQQSDGGWGLSENGGTTVDITGMALQALAPYSTGSEKYRVNRDGQEVEITVKAAVDKGVAYLRKAQALSKDGSLGDCEGTAQAIVAFTALGLDPAKEKSLDGASLVDGLMAYFDNGTGAFTRKESGTFSANAMTTDQALYAIAAYTRFLNGDTSLYDFRDHSDITEYRAEDKIGRTFSADAGTETFLTVSPDVETIVLTHLPLGDYDAAVVTDTDGNTYKTSFRRADGSIPVEGEIPVKDGDVLRVAVTRQDGNTENWTLTVEMSADAAVNAVKRQINKLPGEGALTLSDKAAVEAARKAYSDLTPDQQKEIAKSLTDRLSALEIKLKQLESDAADQLTAKRTELEKKVNAIPSVVGISDKDMVNGYLSQLSSMGEWDGKADLKTKLDNCLKAIAERQALVDQVDDSIWKGINPLDISQDDTETVKKLMASYGALRKEEKAALKNAADLLDAAAVVQSLEEGVVPSRVFRNLRAGGNKRSASGPQSFTYYGFLDDGSPYTLSWDAGDVTGTGDIDAGVALLEGKDTLKGTEAQVELAQQGGMNGKAHLSVKSGAASGTYDLYWYNPDKLSIQSAKTAKVASGAVEMDVTMGGRYWLSDGTVRLDGNNADGSVAGAGSSTTALRQAQGGTLTSRTSSTARTTARTAVKSTTESAAKSSSSTSGSTKSKGSAARTAVRTGGDSDTEGILEAEESGMFSEKELKEIKGKDQNLRGKGKLPDGTEYTVTVNGKDVVKTADFRFDVTDGYEKAIGSLAEEPLVLCLEKARDFPGKMLFSIKKDAEGGTPLLFRYDPKKGEAEYVKKVAAEDGMMEFILSEGGVYFIAERAIAAAGQTDEAGKATVLAAGLGLDAGSGAGEEDVWDESAEIMVTGTGEKSGSGSNTLLAVIAVASCVIAVAALGGSAFMFVKLGGPERFFKKKEELFPEPGAVDGKE